MEIKRCQKESFVVIGKEGQTSDGKDFIQKLWEEANDHFDEVRPLTKRNEKGEMVGFWGAMSDMKKTFQPWDHFKEGLYLAGVECKDDAKAPEGWVKWVIPGYEYIYTECRDDETFMQVIHYMKDHHLQLVGAAHDMTCPSTGKNYIFFPVKKI